MQTYSDKVFWLQSQNAVSAYFTSKQMVHFGFAEHIVVLVHITPYFVAFIILKLGHELAIPVSNE